MIDLTKVGEFIQSQKDRTTETKLFMGELMNKLGDAISNHITPYVHGIVKLRDVKEIDLSIFNTPISLEDEPARNANICFIPTGEFSLIERKNLHPRPFNALIRCIQNEDVCLCTVINMDQGSIRALFGTKERLNYSEFMKSTGLEFFNLDDLLTE